MTTRVSSRQLATAKLTAAKAPAKHEKAAGASKAVRGMRGYAWVDDDGNIVDSPEVKSTDTLEKSAGHSGVKDKGFVFEVAKTSAQQSKSMGNDSDWTTVGRKKRGRPSRNAGADASPQAPARRTQELRSASPASPTIAPIAARILPSPTSAALLRPDSQLRRGSVVPSYAAVTAMVPAVVVAEPREQVVGRVSGCDDAPGAQHEIEPASGVNGAKKCARSQSLVADPPSHIANSTTSTVPPGKRRKTQDNGDTSPMAPTQPARTVRIAPLTAPKRLMLEADADKRSTTELAERETVAKIALQTPDWLSPIGASGLGAALGAMESSGSNMVGGNAELDRRMQARIAVVGPVSVVTSPMAHPKPQKAHQTTSPASSTSPSCASPTLSTNPLPASSTSATLAGPALPVNPTPSRSASPKNHSTVSPVQAVAPDQSHSVPPSEPLAASNPSVVAPTSASEPPEYKGRKAKKKDRKKKEFVRKKGKQSGNHLDDDAADDDTDMPDDTDPEKKFRDMRYFTMPKKGDRLQAMLTEPDAHPTRASGLKGHLYPGRKVCFRRSGSPVVYKHSLPCDHVPVTKYLEPSVVAQRRYQLWPAFAKGGQKLAKVSRSLTIAIHLDLDRSKREVDVWANPWVLAHLGNELDDFLGQVNKCATEIKTEVPSFTDTASVTTMLARDAQLKLEEYEASLRLAQAQNQQLRAKLQGLRPNVEDTEDEEDEEDE